MEEKSKKRITICGVTIYRILAYFIIYSMIGFMLETSLALLAYGKIESRQGFMYGPVCPIYGVGAVIMILALKKFNKNDVTLFLGGVLVGSIVEYTISLFGDIVLNVRWWDYSDRFLNINGRICLLYSICWGLIGVYLTKNLNVYVDKFIEWIKKRINITILRFIIILVTIFLFIDCIISAVAINVFLARTVVENDIKNVQNRDSYVETYEYFYSNNKRKEIVDKYWNEKKMVLTYPNLKLQLDNGKQLYVQDFYKEVKPYYYKFDNNLIDIKL